MTTYIIRQSIYAVFIILGVLTVTFCIIRILPGDPTRLAQGQRADLQSMEALKKEWKLDKPIYVQYVYFLSNAIQGDFGRSYSTNRPVTESILERIPRTALLAVSAMVLATIIGVLIGILSAWKPYTLFDNAAMVFALLGISVPVFVLGALFVLFFTEKMHLIGGTGYITELNRVQLDRLILPMAALAARPLSIFARITRSSMLDTMSMDYIRTARAKGVSEQKTILTHALRNALNPVVTTISAWLAATLAGTFFIEQIFNWPGVGLLAFNAVTQYDFPIIQGVVIFTAIIFVVVNLIVDIIYSFLDPRVRLG
ncbi:MAG: ABC transporter permease [Chlorobi bacterium]|nr:ABC transporter permease [Chlorobiota bacterium]